MNKEHKPTAAEVIGTPPSRTVIYLSTLGLLAIVIGTMIPLFFGEVESYAQLPQFYKFIYGGGALLLLVARLMSRYTGCVIRVKRLYRIETWSALFFCVATFFLFYEPNSSRDWLAFTLAGGALQIFTSIMIPRTIRKALRNCLK